MEPQKVYQMQEEIADLGLQQYLIVDYYIFHQVTCLKNQSQECGQKQVHQEPLCCTIKYKHKRKGEIKTINLSRYKY